MTTPDAFKHPLQVSIDAFIVLVLLLGLGLWLIYKGFDTYRVGRMIRDTATESVQAAAVGRTELVGNATPAGTVLTRPFSEGDCIYANYRIEEEREDSEGDTTWATLDRDTWVTDFHLDDGTGSILVEPEVTANFEISDAHTANVVVPAGASEPEPVAAFLEHGSEVDSTTEHTRRYVEEVIPPGTELYVLGGAEIRDRPMERGEENLVLRRDQGSDRFVISDKTEGALAAGLSRRAPILILIGLVVSSVSLYLLLAEMGVG